MAHVVRCTLHAALLVLWMRARLLLLLLGYRMHGSVGLHSAMAIKRQRRAREEKRRARRTSSAGLGASPATSQSSLRRGHAPGQRRPPADHRLASSIGMLHLGVVFLVLGIFLIGSGLLPDDIVQWRGGGWWNELVATGLFATTIGVFLILINRVMSRKEEEDLNEYVRSQLTRSRSGHRLERDTETGCLTTKQHRRQMQLRREDIERGISDDDIPVSTHEEIPAVHITHQVNGDAPHLLHLEKILEEEPIVDPDDFRRDHEAFNKETMSTTTTASLSPGSPSETRELLNNGKYMHMARI